ncbi:MAG TPA: VOC family protein [Steroidobacteraceae bacterium]|jgi:catechol 2,3-dioxygenase-like lactoylglutathione lyase family enzyme
MNILGPDSLVFGVDDLEACSRYLTDYGLRRVGQSASGGYFEALDGTGVHLRHKSDEGLPPALGTASMLRKIIFGAADAKALAAIEKELSSDRAVKTLPDGSLETVDDAGFVIGFQLSVRRPIKLKGEAVNAPGSDSHRPVNDIGARQDAEVMPRTLSHIVLFLPDADRAERFYTERLGFRVTDRFINLGPFLRPQGSQDHHALFFIQTPPFMKGCEHFTFHVGGPTELMLAGSRFVEKGYTSFWGPGRHKLGSNWFWYFNSPLSCHVEYDADMDLHDDSWIPRAVPANADTSQLFLFVNREKWSPAGGPPPGGAAH